jgi:beta-phosphoglucomutase-like phosphatase (HAD superfamily)
VFNIEVVVFDLDGVLLESADIKTEAFRVLFEGYPAHLDQII